MKKLTAFTPIAVSLFLTGGLFTACSKSDKTPDGGKTPGSGNIDQIALMIDYETGYGGYIYPVYNPYVFFKNGQVVKEPVIPADELNLGALNDDVAADWGTWEKKGSEVVITYHDGSTGTKDWPGEPSYPAQSGQRLNGTYSTLSGGGDLAFGGDVGILSYSDMSFTADGYYTTESIGGVNSSEIAAYHTSTTSGKYSFDGGNSITLTANNGDARRFFFCWYGENSTEVFRLGGRTFTID